MIATTTGNKINYRFCRLMHVYSHVSICCRKLYAWWREGLQIISLVKKDEKSYFLPPKLNCARYNFPKLWRKQKHGWNDVGNMRLMWKLKKQWTFWEKNADFNFVLAPFSSLHVHVFLSLCLHDCLCVNEECSCMNRSCRSDVSMVSSTAVCQCVS